MTFDELEELMSEPPGGDNYGRVRTEGGWRSLETQSVSIEDSELTILNDPDYRTGRRSKRPMDTVPHGVLSTYTNHHCRCEHCRAAKAAYERQRRVK